MKVLHIIPTAFNYFDNIKRFAFQVVELQTDLGMEVDAITLQYSSKDTSKEKRKNREEFQKAVKDKKLGKRTKFPPVNYKGLQNIEEAVKNFNSYDIVHLHTPFLGAGNKILNWKKNNKNKFVISYYNRLDHEDFFGWFIKLYNNYYLPKLFKQADLVIGIDEVSFSRSPARRYISNDKKIVFMVNKNNVDYSHLTENSNRVKLSNYKFKKDMVESMLVTYQDLLKK